MNTAEMLRTAAKHVRRGWCQEVLSNANGEVCAVGALNYVHHHDPFHGYGNDVPALARVVAEALGLPVDAAFAYAAVPDWHYALAVVDWNNDPGQTAENVAAGLEFAAIIVEASGVTPAPFNHEESCLKST